MPNLESVYKLPHSVCSGPRVQWTMIQTSVKRALMALTQDPCFYLFLLILSISAQPNNDTPAACDVDKAKAFDFQSKWVKRQHTCRGRRGEGWVLEEGLQKGWWRCRQEEEKWGVTEFLLLKPDPPPPLLCSSSRGGPLVTGVQTDTSATQSNMKPPKQQPCSFLKPRVQLDPSANRRRCCKQSRGKRDESAFKSFKACNTRSSRENAVNCKWGLLQNTVLNFNWCPLLQWPGSAWRDTERNTWGKSATILLNVLRVNNKPAKVNIKL